MDFSGIQNVLFFFKYIFTHLPFEIYAMYQLIFWCFIVLSVVKVLSWKEGGN